jgi:hypothetical protein
MKSTTVTNSGWDVSFWFAVLSPIIGVLTGYFALLLFFH